MNRRAVIQGLGHAVPDQVLTNVDLERMVDTSNEWIIQRTGIRERRICGPGETTASLGVLAAREALERSNMDASEIEMILVASVCGDYIFPATSCLIQAEIGASRAGAFDVGAACAGFIYAVASASAMIETGAVRSALVIGVDTLSKYVDWTDRGTCVLFGDGAACAVLKGEENTDRGVIKSVLMADGTGAKHICMEVGGTRYRPGTPDAEGRGRHIYMNGAETYRFGVTAMGDACCRVLEEAGLKSDDIALFVPHQANLRIIKSAAERLGLTDDRVFVNVDRYGNTSAASIPLALYEADATGRLKRGDLVLSVGFGAGLVWAANVIRW